MRHFLLFLSLALVLSKNVFCQDTFLDNTFANYGATQQNTNDVVTALCLLADGGIFNVIRRTMYNSNGYLDYEWGNNGKFYSLNDSLQVYYYFTGAKVLQDKSIIMVGGVGGDYALLKLTPEGTADSTFGTDGIVSTNIPRRWLENQWISNTSDWATDIAIQSDNKIVVFGCSQFGDINLVRYYPNGAVDSTFGIGGFNYFKVGKYNADAKHVAIDTKNRIVVTCNSDVMPISDAYAMVIVRFTPEGLIDSSFNNTGMAHFDGNGLNYCNGLKVLPNNKI